MLMLGESLSFIITNAYSEALLRKQHFRVHTSKPLEVNAIPTLEAVHLLWMSAFGSWLPRSSGTIKRIQGEAPVLAGLLGEQVVGSN